jgi:hypothetical protein
MVNSSQSTNDANHGLPMDHASEIYHRLLTLGNDAAAAYVDVYQKTAAGIGEFRDKLGIASRSGWGNAGPGWQPGPPDTEVTERLTKARERGLEISGKMQEMSKKVTLGYLNACELAALALADCHEEIATMSSVDFVKTVGGARVGFTREVTKACVSAAREIVS